MLLLPAFLLVENVTPATVPTLLTSIVSNSPTTTTPLTAKASIPPSLPAALPEGTPAALKDLTTRACPHRALILLCSQRTRDARCGQSAPLLRKEFQRHLQPLGLYRDLDDERPGGVGIYFISHVGGHKYSANVMVYRRPDAFGVDAARRAETGGHLVIARHDSSNGNSNSNSNGNGNAKSNGNEPAAVDDGDGENGLGQGQGQVEREQEQEQAREGDGDGERGEEDVGAGQCIWLARVRPEDCEGIVKFTVLQGKVVKPERQLRGGFDRAKGLLSW